MKRFSPGNLMPPVSDLSRPTNATLQAGEPRHSSRLGTSGSTSAAQPSSPMSRSRWPRASSSASSARTAPARRRCSTSCPGCYRPTAGSIEIDGRDITRDAPYRRARRGSGRTFQISSVFPPLTVLENARLAAEAAPAGRCGSGGAPSGVRKAVERARWALDRVGLGDARAGARRRARARRQAQARARDGARRRPARDHARRADGRDQHRGRARRSWS